MTVFEMIEEQQKGKEGTAVWMVGEQLKDICRREPACEALLMEDLRNPDMSLAKAERKIEEYARKKFFGTGYILYEDFLLLLLLSSFKASSNSLVISSGIGYS